MKTRSGVWALAALAWAGALTAAQAGSSLSFSFSSGWGSASAYREVRDVRDFYAPLEPYGMWVEYESYGRVWRPGSDIQCSGWRPYCHGGRWVWTDWGWSWESEYPWGWACFHYGRWLLTPHMGWVWVPDTVWGPAWVSWRSTDSHYGWAPLPPCGGASVGFGFGGDWGSVDVRLGLRDVHYTFVPCHAMLDYRVDRYCVPYTECRTYYGRSVVVQQHFENRGSRVACRSLPPETVYGHSRRSYGIRSVVQAAPPVRAAPPVAVAPVPRPRPPAPVVVAPPSPSRPPAPSSSRSYGVWSSRSGSGAWGGASAPQRPSGQRDDGHGGSRGSTPPPAAPHYAPQGGGNGGGAAPGGPRGGGYSSPPPAVTPSGASQSRVVVSSDAGRRSSRIRSVVESR